MSVFVSERRGLCPQGDSPDREIERDPNVVRSDDQGDRLVRSDTTSRMLRQFQEMERQGGEKKGKRD